MPEMTEQLSQIDAMLKDLNGKLETQGADGKPVNLLDVFKMFPELQEKYSSLEKRLEEFEKQSKSRKWANLDLGKDGDNFSILRAAKAVRFGDWKGAELEKEVFRNTRALASGDDSVGGYLVPAQAIPDIIEMLRAKAQVIAMGATVVDNLVGAPVTFPKQTGGATAYWIGENASITPSDLGFGQIKMTPKKIAALVQISNDLLRRGGIGVDAMVRRDIAQSLALAIDLAALRGSGSQYQPLGIANTAGINTVTLGSGSGAVPDLDVFSSMEYELSVDNALQGSLGVLFHPAIKKVLKQLKIAQYSGDTGGDYVLRPPTDADMEAMIGYLFKLTTQIPINLVLSGSTNVTEIYFANWQELLIGQWMGFEILASNQAGTAFSDDQTWIRIISEIDIAVRHAESFCLCSSARIASSN